MAELRSIIHMTAIYLHRAPIGSLINEQDIVGLPSAGRGCQRGLREIEKERERETTVYVICFDFAVAPGQWC